LDRFDQRQGAKVQEMWFIFKPFATKQMAKKRPNPKNGKWLYHAASPRLTGHKARSSHASSRDFAIAAAKSASFMGPYPIVPFTWIALKIHTVTGCCKQNPPRRIEARAPLCYAAAIFPST